MLKVLMLEAPHRTATGARMPYGITQSYLPTTRQRQRLLLLTGPYRPVLDLSIKDERLSRPEPTRVNDLPSIATEMPAIPRVTFSSLGTEGVNNLPTVVTQ